MLCPSAVGQVASEPSGEEALEGLLEASSLVELVVEVVVEGSSHTSGSPRDVDGPYGGLCQRKHPGQQMSVEHMLAKREVVPHDPWLQCLMHPSVAMLIEGREVRDMAESLFAMRVASHEHVVDDALEPCGATLRIGCEEQSGHIAILERLTGGEHLG